MPVVCFAFGCNNRESLGSGSCGMTFHGFTSVVGLERGSEAAIRREEFVVTEFSRLCRETFNTEDLNRTRQREDVILSVFSFPSHLQTVPVSHLFCGHCGHIVGSDS